MPSPSPHSAAPPASELGSRSSAAIRVLVVDDEPDVHAVTGLSLRGLKHEGRRVKLVNASSGKEAVEAMRADPDISVILLDVVMENDRAGLDACEAIRKDNPFVRILLRTGQPGQAPEKDTIDAYDIDGYLPKAELTGARLYVAVRTAIRAWERLIEVDRHRRYLAAVHDCAVSLHSFDGLEVMLERILETATLLCPTRLAVLLLETFEEEGNPKRVTLHLSTSDDPVAAEAEASAAISKAAQETATNAGGAPREVDGGFLLPFSLHRELGSGFIYLREALPDEPARKALPLLAGHAANALYSSVAERMLEAQRGPVFDTMAI